MKYIFFFHIIKIQTSWHIVAITLTISYLFSQEWNRVKAVPIFYSVFLELWFCSFFGFDCPICAQI